MKPAAFDYQAPGTLREAIDLLASNPEASPGDKALCRFSPSVWQPRACWSICGGYPASAILN